MASTSTNYGLILPDSNDFITVGSQIQDNFETIDTELKRVDTLASNPSSIKGRLWRTSGFLSMPDTPAVLDFEGSRVSGGMTVASGGDGLIVPVDGFYDIRLNSYATGSTDWLAQFSVYRVRAGQDDRVVVYVAYNKKGSRDSSIPGSDIVPLKANDKINVKITSEGSVGSTWGVDEVSGVRLNVKYDSPLSGVTPV